MIEKNQLSELYSYMEKKGIVGGVSPDTVGKTISPSERDFLISETREYIFKKFPKSIDAEVHIAGSLSEARGGMRKFLHERVFQNGSFKKRGYKKSDWYIPSDLHYISDLDVGIVNSELFGYISTNWQEAIGPLEWGDSTINIDTRHILGEEERPKFWDSIPKDLEGFILKISIAKYAGRTRPLEIKFFKENVGKGTICDADKYVIKR